VELSGWLRRNRKKLRLCIPHNHTRTTHPTQKMKAGLFAVVAVALLVTLVAAGAQGASAPIPGFRPPAVPLVLMDPYMNVWLRGTNLTDAWATYVPLPSSFFSRPSPFAFFPKWYNNFNENMLCRYWDGTVKALVGVRPESVFLFWFPPIIMIIISFFLIGRLAYWGTSMPQLVRIDGTAFRFMGPEGEAGGNLPQPIQQLSSTVRAPRREIRIKWSAC